MEFSRTVIISCAGIGNRLGLGTTKALIDVAGKPLIIRHLEHLETEEPYLPMEFMKIRTREIDTVNDYEQAVNWIGNGYQ